MSGPFKLKYKSSAFPFKTSLSGYRRDSVDKHESKLLIPNSNISMKNVPFNVRGEDNLGNVKIMKPGKNYKFPGDYVIETRLG